MKISIFVNHLLYFLLSVLQASLLVRAFHFSFSWTSSCASWILIILYLQSNWMPSVLGIRKLHEPQCFFSIVPQLPEPYYGKKTKYNVTQCFCKNRTMEKGEKSIHHGQPCNYEHAEENLPFVLNSKATYSYKRLEISLPTIVTNCWVSKKTKYPKWARISSWNKESRWLFPGSESSVDFREVFTAKL